MSIFKQFVLHYGSASHTISAFEYWTEYYYILGYVSYISVITEQVQMYNISAI